MLSKHAEVRIQQRCIPLDINLLLDQFGAKHYTGNGAIIRYFSKASINVMKKKIGQELILKLKRYFNAYKVVSVNDESTITIGYRTKRIWRR